MHRRALLAGAASLAAALAGCSVLDAGSDGAATHNVRLENAHSEAHEVTLTLVREGETLVDETRTLGADRDWAVGTFETAGEYDLTVSALGDEESRSYTLPIAEGDRESFAVASITDAPELDVVVYRQE